MSLVLHVCVYCEEVNSGSCVKAVNVHVKILSCQSQSVAVFKSFLRNRYRDQFSESISHEAHLFSIISVVMIIQISFKIGLYFLF